MDKSSCMQRISASKSGSATVCGLQLRRTVAHVLPAQSVSTAGSKRGQCSDHGIFQGSGKRQASKHVCSALFPGNSLAENALPSSLAPTFKIQLLQPVESDDPEQACTKLLVFFPGTDGTGQAIIPQIPALRAQGYDIWCLYVPPQDRSDWMSLTRQTTLLLRQLTEQWHATHPTATPTSVPLSSSNGSSNGSSSVSGQGSSRVTLVAESFGACLALRVALQAPELISNLVLANPATAFNQSLAGLSAFVSGTNLLGFFPQSLYAVAQATLLPLLVDPRRVSLSNTQLLQNMVFMTPPSSRQKFAFDADDSQDHLFYAPAQAANFRAGLLRVAALPDEELQRIKTPTLLISSAKDRMLPSIVEGARLINLLPNARRVILPDSGHAAFLEEGVCLATILKDAEMIAECSPRKGSTDIAGPALVAAAGNGNGNDVLQPAFAAANGNGSISRAAAYSNGNGVLPAVVAESSSNSNGSVSTQVPSMLSVSEEGARAVRALSSTAGVSVASSSSSSSTNANGGSSSRYTSSVDSSGPVTLPNRTGFAVADSRPAKHTASSDQSGSSSSSSSNGSFGGAFGAAASPPSQNGNGQGSSTAVRGPPSSAAFDEWTQRLTPWRELVSPVVLGSLPPTNSPLFNRPMLFVGNHQRMGLYDMPLLMIELYLRGYEMRGLAHPGHWSGPLGPFFEQFGAVKASPMAAFRLLKGNEKVLLFPGGAREVTKRRGEEYTLLWKDSPDFVRLATKCKAVIVPFAAVGADDAYDVILDTQEVLDNPVTGYLARSLLSRMDTGADLSESVWPITRLPGVGLPSLFPVPNLQRLYFKFAEPIDTAAAGVDPNNTEQMVSLYQGVKAQVNQSMQELLELRSQDAEQSVGPRLRSALASYLPVLQAAAAVLGPKPRLDSLEGSGLGVAVPPAEGELPVLGQDTSDTPSAVNIVSSTT